MILTTLRLLSTARILAVTAQKSAARRTAAGVVGDTGDNRWVDNHLLTAGHTPPAPVPLSMPEPFPPQGERGRLGGGGSPGTSPGGRYRPASACRGSSPRQLRTPSAKRPGDARTTVPVVRGVRASCGAAAVKV